MKKIISFTLAIIVKSLLFASDFQINGINYNIISATTVAVAAYGDKAYSGNITIPEKVENLGKTFTVTSIQTYAFVNCTALTSINMPNSITTIDWAAFEGCKGLTNLILPTSLVSTGGYSFVGCSNILTISFPKSLRNIGNSSFANCSGITTVSLPDSIKTIGDFAFDKCYRITDINLPNTITYLGAGAFDHCQKLTSIILPNSITSIGHHTFAGCENISSFVLPNSVKSIGDYAFEYCYSLTKITLPDSLFSIGTGAFNGCNRLKNIQLPASLVLLGSEAFVNCTGLLTITIPSLVKVIEKGTFSGCTNLTSIALPNSITSIESSAFLNCINLEGCFSIPKLVTKIGFYAFKNCNKLTVIILPNSISTIGYEAFYNCPMLKTVYCLSISPPSLSDEIFNSFGSPILYMPASSISKYKSYDYWKNYTYASATIKNIICGEDARLSTKITDDVKCHTLHYKWNPAMGLNNNTIASPSFSLPTNSTYTVDVTIPDYGVIATDTLKIKVNPLVINAGSDKTIICGSSTQLDKVTTNYTGIGTLKYKWKPSTGLNNDTLINPLATIISDFKYVVTVTTSNGCTASDEVIFSATANMAEPIKSVSVDSKSNNKNVVTWNNINSNVIDSVIIFRESNKKDVFDKIGTAPYTLAKFIDNDSQPLITSTKYKIELVNKCGLKSPQSEFHKTIFLSTKEGENNTLNLNWEPYLGFDVATYNIYRGTSTTNLLPYGFVVGNINQYEDKNSITGKVFYQIEAIASKDNNISSFSNIATGIKTGLRNLIFDDSFFTIYPNPAKDEFIISHVSNLPITYSLYNLLGELIRTESLFNINNRINISNLPDNLLFIEVKSNNRIGRQKLIIQK